jgi:hypothetical protein
VVLVGGSDGTKHFDDAFLLQHDNGDCTLTALPPLPAATAYAAGAMIGDTVWIIGGQPSATAPVASGRLFSLDRPTLMRGVNTPHCPDPHASCRSPARYTDSCSCSRGAPWWTASANT